MENNCRSREKTEDWRGRKRNYHCSECNKIIHADTLNPIPEIDRVCPECRAWTIVFTFINKRSGKEKQVRAHGVELATLRAWKISPNLTFKIPQEVKNERD